MTPTTPNPDDVLTQAMEAVKKAEQDAQAVEEAEALIAELDDLTDTQALYFNKLIERGVPAKAAIECLGAQADNYWFHRFQAQFRRQG
jgi:hypothetical protein